MTITPLAPIAGAPTGLIVALNARLRQIAAGVADSSTTAKASASLAGPYAIELGVDGTLGIASRACLPVYLAAAITPRSIVAHVIVGPVGADLTFDIVAGGTVWASLTIPSGATDATAAVAAPLPADAPIFLSITGVGTTTPGARLTVVVYF